MSGQSLSHSPRERSSNKEIIEEGVTDPQWGESIPNAGQERESLFW